jgi:hypothetical protein
MPRMECILCWDENSQTFADAAHEGSANVKRIP